MTEKPNPAEVVIAMVRMAGEAGSTENLLPLGAFANYYSDQIAGDLNEDNVQAFMHGAAVVNLLIQDVLIRTSMGAKEVLAEAEGEMSKAYSTGTVEGINAVALLIAKSIEPVMRRATEQPLVDREFSAIINAQN